MEKFEFLLESKDKQARAGVLQTRFGRIKTPVFMPVGTLGSVKAIFPEDLKKLDIEIILANTYHLMLRPGDKLIRDMGGIQKFINWNKPILTDSGGYQIWSLSKIRKINEEGVSFMSHIDGKKINLTPENSIKIQENLNSDISMVLDECTEYPASYKRALESMELSLRWAKRCKIAFRQRTGFGLFGIVQGGMFGDLRKKCSCILNEIGFDGYAIGGLSVGEPHELMIDIVKKTLENICISKPRYLMGVGRPVDIIKAVESGIDMFDCVIPTRFGRNGRAITSSGEINLRNACYAKDESPIDSSVDCYVSKSFSRSYIHHLTKSNEILSSMIISLHNIAFYKKMMSDIRESIFKNKFDDLKKSYLKYHEKYKKT